MRLPPSWHCCSLTAEVAGTRTAPLQVIADWCGGWPVSSSCVAGRNPQRPDGIHTHKDDKAIALKLDLVADMANSFVIKNCGSINVAALAHMLTGLKLKVIRRSVCRGAVVVLQWWCFRGDASEVLQWCFRGGAVLEWCFRGASVCSGCGVVVVCCVCA